MRNTGLEETFYYSTLKASHFLKKLFQGHKNPVKMLIKQDNGIVNS